MITLKTLPKATPSEVFWQAFDVLTSQKAMSFFVRTSGLISCRYRDGRGNRCGAGTVFSDAEYDPNWEGDTWPSLVKYYDVIPNDHCDLITDIQRFHDVLADKHKDGSMPTPEEWIEQFEFVVGRHGIEGFPPAYE